MCIFEIGNKTYELTIPLILTGDFLCPTRVRYLFAVHNPQKRGQSCLKIFDLALLQPIFFFFLISRGYETLKSASRYEILSPGFL